MKDYSAYLPMGLPQYLKQDTFTCSCHAAIDSIETQEFYKTGVRNQYSRRWLCYMSHTTPEQGNSEQVVFKTIKDFGLVLESSWPQRPDMTNAEFYTPPTPEQAQSLAYEGLDWVNKWDITYDFYLPFSRQEVAPLIVRVNTGSTFHFMEVLNDKTYYDSEYHHGYIGPIPSAMYPVVVEYCQIIIKPKGEIMVGYKVVGDPTTYVELGGKFVALADFKAFEAMGGSSGSIVELTVEQFSKFPKVDSVLFKSK